MTKKYELIDETMEFEGHTLHRIRAIKDFGVVKIGDLGGWIESEDNLSHFENCWVYDNAKVFLDAKVWANAKVCGEAEVCGNASVFDNADVCESACVFGNAKVFGGAWVRGDAKVFGNAKVFGGAKVYGDAEVYGNACVFGWSKVNGDATVRGDSVVYEDALVSGNDGGRQMTKHVKFLFQGPCVSGADFERIVNDFLTKKTVGKTNVEIKPCVHDGGLAVMISYDEDDKRPDSEEEDKMTNFEKWKAGLKPEDMVVTDFSISMGCCAFYGHFNECIGCPARDECQNGGEDASCEEAFLRWAKTPAREEGK